MNFIEVTAGENDSNRRLDRVLRNYISEAGLSKIYSSLRKGLIKVNSSKVKPEYKIQSGDVIKIADFLLQNKSDSKENSTQPAENFKFPHEIVFQNQNILLINKPYNIQVHGSKDSLDKQVQDFFALKDNSSSLSFKPGPLHRLDKKTTGLLAFSWSIQGAQWFTKNISEHSIQKIYTGVLQGKLTDEENWVDFIDSENKEQKNRFYTVNAVSNKSAGDKDHKESITFVKPLEYGSFKGTDYTIAEIKILTGRTHQIRAQSALHGFPLLGDTAYGGKKISSSRDFFLHATTLIFPQDNPLELPSSVSCPCQKEVKKFLNK